MAPIPSIGQRHELGYLAHQVAGDALLSITADLEPSSGSTRNVIDNIMFDARRELRAAPALTKYLLTSPRTPGTSGIGEDRTRDRAGGRKRGEAAMAGWARSARFLDTDPGDVGCEWATDLLHVYVDLARDDASRPRRPAGTRESRRTCSPADPARRTTAA